MSTKFQAKKRKASRQKTTPNEDEIVEIEEVPIKKTSRKNPKIAENSTSETTSPNKKNNIKNQNKKKKRSDLIEIMDIETPEDDGKVSSQVHKPKKSIDKKNIDNKEKSIDKNKVKEKSPKIKGKKNNKKIASITLDESENENESESKINEINKKSTSRTPRKKTINKSKDNPLVQEKKNKKNEKRNIKKKEKEEDVIQCEISSESENEKIKEIKTKPQKKRMNNKKNKDLSPDKFNSGYLSCCKMSLRKKKNNDNENDELKPKSTIKISLKDDSMKSKMGNLLGKKRKHESLNKKIPSPNKKTNKSESTTTQNQKRNPPSQNNTGKQKSRTPLKNNSKKNNRNKIDLNSPTMDIDDENSENNYTTPEIAVLNQLISEYGFEKVLNCFCKSKLDPKKKLDSCLQGLKNSCSHEKLTFLLIKMLYSYFNSKFEEKSNFSDKKRSTSVNRPNNLKNIADISNKEKAECKCQIKDNNNNSSNNNDIKDQCENENPIEIKISKEKNKNSCIEDNKSRGVKNVAKADEKKGEKRMMSIGSHYNKDEDGNIYKFQVASLDGKGNAIFKCYDDKCNGMGMYNLETKQFTITKKHTLLHTEHDYILNNDKEDNVFKDLTEAGKSDAQVFKENGERTVKMY